MKTCCLGVVFVLSFSSVMAFAQGEPDFRKAKWGDSYSKVTSIETAERLGEKYSIAETTNFGQRYNITMGGYAGAVVYVFSKDETLLEASYTFGIGEGVPHLGAKDFGGLAVYFMTQLRAKYGEPSSIKKTTFGQTLAWKQARFIVELALSDFGKSQFDDSALRYITVSYTPPIAVNPDL